ncbi:MAG: toll/interleukin-1 receptor domain-containing protein [Tepidisphaeraceae bacterium]
MFSVFISYSHKNLEQAQRVREELKRCRGHVFLAKESFRPGDAVTPTIMREVEKCDVFLLLWSAQAAASRFVDDEVKAAVSSRRFILPVKLDDSALPAMLGDIHYVSAASAADGDAALQQVRDVVLPKASKKNAQELAMILLVCVGAIWALSGDAA